MKFVKISHVCLRGLIQLRNDLVYYISANKLPTELKNEDRVCSKCPQIRVCSLLQDRESSQATIGVYENSISHLNDAHMSFFHKWYQMLELEFSSSQYKQFDAGELIWWKSQRELEASGFSVFDLALDLKSSKSACFAESQQSEQLSTDRFFSFDFVKTNGKKSIAYFL